MLPRCCGSAPMNKLLGAIYPASPLMVTATVGPTVVGKGTAVVGKTGSLTFTLTPAGRQLLAKPATITFVRTYAEAKVRQVVKFAPKP